MRAFADAIWAKVSLLKETTLSASERRRVLESIDGDIRKCTDLLVPRVSRAARETAGLLQVDLTRMGWHDQPRFDPGRTIFHLEHFYPVGAVRNRCLTATSQSDIGDVLGSAKVAWILKVEDRKLSDLGFKNLRPDPDEAYRKAGIALE